jgi:nicotinamidase-related amidase
MSSAYVKGPGDGNGSVLKGPRAASSLLSPDNSVLALIDHQGLMIVGVESHPIQQIVNNLAGLAKAAKLFGVPTVLTSGGVKSWGGPILPELTAVFPDHEAIDRTTLNAWEDGAFVEAIEATGRRKLLVSGLWTEVCVAFPVLSALEAGYDVYVVVDTCGAADRATHDAALQRMAQAGAVLVSWIDVMCEWQRDWTRYQDLREEFMSVVRAHGGAFGQAITFEFGITGRLASPTVHPRPARDYGDSALNSAPSS